LGNHEAENGARRRQAALISTAASCPARERRN
jgi:hypothetical protein